MRKTTATFIASFLLASVIFLSCQREIQDPSPKTSGKVSSKDPVALSASLKVWHGTRTIGTPPAPTRNTPAIDPTVNLTIRAVAGHYAIIKPEITAGNVAGYYLGIPGAGQYFKVDYSKPRNIAGRGIKPKHTGIMQRGQGIQDGTADSSIVIVLPSNINVPDTFCVTYCPYDSSGNIGQPVTTCIYVASLGAGANEGWIQNDFKVTSSWEDSSGIRITLDTFIFNKWYASNSGGYYCANSPTPPFLIYSYSGTGLINDSVKYTKNNIRFATNGAFDYKENLLEKYVDTWQNSCSQFVFQPIITYADSTIGGYSYNATTSKLVFIVEFDASGIPDPEYWEYDVIKLNNNHFILRDPIDNFFIRFER